MNNGGDGGSGGGGCRVWTQKEAGLIPQIGDSAEFRLAVKGNRRGQCRKKETCQLHTQLMLNQGLKLNYSAGKEGFE